MDLDGNGRDGSATLRDLIKASGAVVDCYMDNDGNIVGAVSTSTRYLVLGDARGDKGAAKSVKNYDDIVSKADHFAATKLTLAELKEKIGYKKTATNP
jgi:hypothetical protein